MTPPSTEAQPTFARLQILAGSILWGTTGTAQALAPPGAVPVAVATVRVVLGGIVLVAIAALRSTLRALPLKPILFATSGLVIAQLSFFASVEITGVSLGTVVAIGTAPMAAGALAWITSGRRPGPGWVAATALGIVGCSILFLGDRAVEVRPLGVLLALVVGVGYAVVTAATKELIDKNPPDAVIAVVFGLSAVCMMPLLLVVDLHWMTRLSGALIAVHLGFITIGLAYTLFARGLNSVPAPTAVTLTLAEPVTAAFLGIVVLNEPLSGSVMVGIFLVLLGLLILSLPSTSKD